MNAKTVATISLVSVLAGCTGSPVTSETITRVRVIAVRAEPAGAHPGESVKLDALVVSPVPDDPDIHIVWYTCQYATFELCAKAHDLHQIGEGPSITTTVSASASPGDVAVFWIDAKKGGQVERALKSINVVEPGVEPNHNPDLKSVRFVVEGTKADSTTTAKNARLDVHVVARPTPEEIYFDSNENAAEELRVLTYTTGGFLVDPSGTSASGELYFTAPDATGRYGNWIVINDGRGGVDWKTVWIDVTASSSTGGGT